ncbi:sigma-54-dependent Fis family transcriptional regulator [bacterium]|nr:sigma-54-dependent Fis family transcriptional regulator [bacterium]
MKTILIVDDEKNTLAGLTRFLKSHDFNCIQAENGKEALDCINAFPIDLLITDLRMPVLSGMDLITHIQTVSKSIPIIVLTAYGTVETAVECLKKGASDFLTKPINLDKLLVTVNHILENYQLREENAQLRRQISNKYGLENIIGNSAAMQKVYDTVKQVAPSRATVLIQGESGTGKELVAKAIHQLSTRKDHPFVPVHCAALTENLLLSELFGHERGAFTGALEKRTGRFEQADKGSIFLDEVSEINMDIQVKLLRVIQEQAFERVGGTKTIHVDLRFIAATNKDLEQQMRQNLFREDLFYRLNVVTVNLPPLRERTEDIPLLLTHYLKVFKNENNRPVLSFSQEVVKILTAYSWPGNVRELRNCIENMVVLSKNDILLKEDIPLKILNNDTSIPQITTLIPQITTLQSSERNQIEKVLQECSGNRVKAAQMLGISRRTLYRKIERYGIK